MKPTNERKWFRKKASLKGRRKKSCVYAKQHRKFQESEQVMKAAGKGSKRIFDSNSKTAIMFTKNLLANVLKFAFNDSVRNHSSCLNSMYSEKSKL